MKFPASDSKLNLVWIFKQVKIPSTIFIIEKKNKEKYKFLRNHNYVIKIIVLSPLLQQFRQSDLFNDEFHSTPNL